MILDLPRRLMRSRREEAGVSRVCAQMGLAAGFGASAARAPALQPVLDEACRVAARGAGAGFARLLVHRAEERRFVLQAGVGWRDGLVGVARLDADTGTAAGFAWHSGRSVLSGDMVAEGRFRVPELLAAHGVASSLDVVVPGAAGGPAFGVLTVESRGRGGFRAADASFLELVAHGVAAAAARIAERALHEAHDAQGAMDHQAALGEMHHRVRNDLQSVCAFLAAESRGVDAGQRLGYARIGGRVVALAGLYDHLRGAGAGSEVEFAAYLRVLCLRIAEAGGLEARSIDVHVDARPVAMGRGRALSLAVAVNELVSNAAEHAFAGRGFGRITVTLRPAGQGGAVLGVADQGCGFAGPRPGGAGLGFVERLVRQAGGVLAREEGEGTRWRIVLGAEE